MTVAFNNTAAVIRAPLFCAEVNAGIPPFQGISRTILVGRVLAAGSVKAGQLVPLGSQDPNGLFGPGSMLADMALFARNFNQTGAVWALAVADPTGGAAGSGSFAITGTATSPGKWTRGVVGERYDTPVANGDTPAIIAANVAAEINAGYVRYNKAMLAPVIATAAAGTGGAWNVTLTARHTGVESTMILLEAGLDGDELEVPGVVVTSTAMSGGTGIVDAAAVLATMGVQPGDWFASPYSQVQQLNAAQSFFADSGSGRWSPMVGLGGHYITLNDGNLSAQTSFGVTRDDRHASVLATNGYSHPGWSWVAALTGVVGLSKNLGASLSDAIEIARPLQTLQLLGLRGPADKTKQWGLADREALYSAGLSAVTFGPDGTPQIDRVLTTYQTNAYGVEDITFLGIETIAIAAYVRAYIKQVVTSTYPRCVLRDDNPTGLQGVVTPNQAKATMIHAYTQLCNIAGVVENAQLFAQYLIVERDTDPNRLNAYLPIDVANQLVVFASNLTIFPQFDQSTIALQ